MCCNKCHSWFKLKAHLLWRDAKVGQAPARVAVAALHKEVCDVALLSAKAQCTCRIHTLQYDTKLCKASRYVSIALQCSVAYIVTAAGCALLPVLLTVRRCSPAAVAAASTRIPGSLSPSGVTTCACTKGSKHVQCLTSLTHTV
jgi:hypothetical protein